MLKARTVGTMLCLGALTALPACSMFGGGDSGSSQYRQSSYNSPAGQSASMQQTPPPGTNMTREAAITPRMIRAVQHKLKDSNLYAGRVDGVWGPMTQRGVREWQQQHNQNATGQLDMATLQAMNIDTGNNQQYGQGQGNGTNQSNYSTAGSHQTGSNYSSATPNTNNMTNTPQGNQPNANPPANGANGSGPGNNGTGQPGTGQPGH